MTRRRYVQPTLTLRDIAGIEEVQCCGETHRLVLRTDGQIALPDHPRQLLRLEDWAQTTAKIETCGCLLRVRALRATLKQGWDGMPRVDYGTSTAPRVLYALRSNALQCVRKAREALKRADGDPLTLPFSVRIMRHAELVFRGLVQREFPCANGRELRVRRWQPSDGDCQRAMAMLPNLRNHRVAAVIQRRTWEVYFDVVRWYTRVYLREPARVAVIDKTLVLKVLEWSTDGKAPRVIVGLRPTPGGQAGTVGIANVSDTGKVRFAGGK